MPLSLTRRGALVGAAATPLALSAAGAGFAQANGGLPMAQARGFKLGSLEVTTLLAGTTSREDPHSIFGLNVSDEAFAAASAAHFIGTEAAQFYFTPTVVKAGANVILFDTGLNAGGITSALSAGGYTPDDITHVVITHMHGDHIGGLMNEGAPTFANAVYLTGQREYDHWAAQGNERFDGMVKPLADKMSFLADGDAVAPGITAVAQFGHTPGMMGYMLESNGAQLMLIADLANHYVYSLGYPDWEVRFDMDKPAAAATRRRILGMLAADKVPMIGYHMPFPAAGFVEANGDGFRYVPVSYQMMG